MPSTSRRAPAGLGGADDPVDERDQAAGDRRRRRRRRSSCARARPSTRARSAARGRRRRSRPGTLTKKIHGHDSTSTRMPPSTRPTAPPPTAIAAQTPSAFVRSAPSVNVVVTIESAAGETSAAPRPCSPRATISIVSPVASAAEERGGREEDEAGEEHALAADQVAGAAAEQQEAAEQERVGVDDPLQARLGDPEVGLDRRQRDVHDRRVEHDHELREADEDEDEPRIHAVRGGHLRSTVAAPPRAAGYGFPYSCLLRTGHGGRLAPWSSSTPATASPTSTGRSRSTRRSGSRSAVSCRSATRRSTSSWASPATAQPELELTYNFGVDSYELGTAYGHIALTVERSTTRSRARRAGHRAREAAVLGARGRLAALLRPRPRRLPDRADRALRLLTEPALRRPVDHTVATRRPSASAERGACACQFDNYIVVK